MLKIFSGALQLFTHLWFIGQQVGYNDTSCLTLLKLNCLTLLKPEVQVVANWQRMSVWVCGWVGLHLGEGGHFSPFASVSPVSCQCLASVLPVFPPLGN